MLHRLCLLVGLQILLGSTATAHYLWVSIDRTSKSGNTARIFFEEGPAAGDGHYLDSIIPTFQAWVRTVDDPTGATVDVADTRQEKLRWLQTPPLTQKAPRSIDAYAKFGVYRYGKTDVLLHYYARTLDLAAHEDLHELGRAEQMKLDLVPHDFGNRLTVNVLWKGQPVADRKVFIRGPQGFRRNLTTDAEGNVVFKIEKSGRYLFRSFVELDQQGTEGDKSYSLIRHHATLSMKLPLEE